MKRVNLIFWMAFCIVLYSLTANAQPPASPVPKADPRVAKALKEANVEFQISSKDGGYEVTYGTKINRKQTGFIASDANVINGVEMRIVFSFAMFSNAAPSPQIANLLLEENMMMSSAWAILKSDKQYAVVNRIYVPADLSGAKLDSVLQEVVVMTDAMEEKLTKEDVH